MKKLVSLVLALCMLMMVGAAFAAEGDHLTTAEDTISATGLESGDSLTAYQLIEWKDGDWALTSFGTSTGIALANLIDGITPAEATTIFTALANAEPTYTLTESNGTWSKSDVAAGMYYLKATANAEHANIIYNPAFVSADYNEGGNTVSFGTAIGESAVMKKSSVPFNKEINDDDQTKFQDVKPGDVIPFVVTSTIPSYGTAFTNPVFTIEDTLSTGLALKAEPKVFIDDVELTGDAKAAAYTYTAKADGAGYTIAFNKSYLTGLNGTQPAVKVTYSADVTTAALNNVTYMDNEAKLTYSNTPTTTKDQDDITRHYTFSIDGNLLGHTGEQTHELIKTACDADGNPIYSETTQYYDGGVNPLDGASFTLTPIAPTTGSEKTITSADGGHIQFLGLDAGSYTLVENSAPAGYVKDSRTYVVEIIPHYDDDTSNAPKLLSYDVKFKVQGEDKYLTTSTFTTTNEGPTVTTSSHAADGQYIGNTPGNGLPSTGGIGTTIFYILGGLLVVGAAVILIARRKAQD